MTRVCLVGDDEYDLRYELLSRETAREALATYDIGQPYANSVAVDTVSLGAAVALLNDLDWYLARFASAAFVREPSVSDTEWLSRALATQVRNDAIDPETSDRYLAVYGVSEGSLVEPMYVRRRDTDPDGSRAPIPEYDLQEVEETVVVRATEAEFGG